MSVIGGHSAEVYGLWMTVENIYFWDGLRNRTL